jgi:murein DD-endopeptidase MepM/ murein hydrolase activator NlpD
VTRGFDPPATRYGPGHLGVDLQAEPGTRVRAAGPGVVAFAGSVAGALHVVVSHDGALRTSYSFLATVTVRTGQRIEAGAIVGTTGGTGEQHDGRALHLGLRRGSTYLDPMQLFAGGDLAVRVHLAPSGGARPPSEETTIRAGFPEPDYPMLCAGQWCNSPWGSAEGDG